MHTRADGNTFENQMFHIRTESHHGALTVPAPWTWWPRSRSSLHHQKKTPKTPSIWWKCASFAFHFLKTFVLHFNENQVNDGLKRGARWRPTVFVALVAFGLPEKLLYWGGNHVTNLAIKTYLISLALGNTFTLNKWIYTFLLVAPVLLHRPDVLQNFDRHKVSFCLLQDPF